MKKTYPLTALEIQDCFLTAAQPSRVNYDSLPPWAARFIPKVLWILFPAYLQSRTFILVRCRDRWSCEKITGLKIYLGHTAIADSVGVRAILLTLGITIAAGWDPLLALALAFAVGGGVGFFWWVGAETADTIQFGLSWDMAYDGLEYAIAFVPMLVTAAAIYWLMFIPIPLWIYPTASTFVMLAIWFHLLPKRAEVG